MVGPNPPRRRPEHGRHVLSVPVVDPDGSDHGRILQVFHSRQTLKDTLSNAASSIAVRESALRADIPETYPG